MDNTNIRNMEYYGLTGKFTELYEKSGNGETFKNLMDIIESENNIRLAFRNLCTNSGSNTPGVDKATIKEIKAIETTDMIEKVRAMLRDYHPKAVRRKDIPKPNGSTRPLGIPAIWDRLVQMCIKQVLEPICEAKFSEHSHGFRPHRSAETAMQEVYSLMQRQNFTYAVSIDIKGFFDNVNHRKLIRQLWTLGIQDTRLLQVISAMLKAPIKLEDGTIEHPTKGTPQGGILSPLLANVVLNELDKWLFSQWEGFAMNRVKGIKAQYRKDGRRDVGNEIKVLRRSNLKEIKFVRYADDFVIFTKSRQTAVKIKEATIKWLSERLRLEVSTEKTKILNLKRKYLNYLGFKIKIKPKGRKRNGETKYVVDARMSDKAVVKTKQDLKNAVKLIQHTAGRDRRYAIDRYNAVITGKQNYYGIANNVTKDFNKIHDSIRKSLRNRLKTDTKHKAKEAKNAWQYKSLKQKFGKSKQVRWIEGRAVVPISYYKARNPMAKERVINDYTLEGRNRINELSKKEYYSEEFVRLMLKPIKGESALLNENRITLFTMQKGKSRISGRLLSPTNVEVHHKLPRYLGGTDEFANLCLITRMEHKLIHAVNKDIINKYLRNLGLNAKSLKKVNALRELAELEPIC